ITLKNGRVINGNYLGGSPRQVKVEIGDRIQTIEVSDIARIDFGGVAVMPSSRLDDQRPAAPHRDNAAPVDESNRPVLRRSENDRSDNNVLRPDANPARAPLASVLHDPVNLPAGTNLVVRMIDGVES